MLKNQIAFLSSLEYCFIPSSISVVFLTVDIMFSYTDLGMDVVLTNMLLLNVMNVAIC